MIQLTLGSLFDGIGGFPLAGIYSGMKPIWASEIEPFPIRVTRMRLPFMKHYGDIHKLRGGELEPVDVVTFGSPCQNLSVAGKRAGLQGEQSSLFFEAVRVITEMRCSSHGQYPKWAVWENVPGALSSCDGQDFHQVLTELIRIKEPQADVPMPESGKWLAAGEILGSDYSLAWRVIDASKGWGVAQRRKRIFVVVHFNGPCAGKVLFESEGLSRYSPPGAGQGQGIASGSSEGAGTSGPRIVLNDMGGARMDVTENVTHTLRAQNKGHPPLVLDCSMNAGGFCTEHSADSRGIGYENEKSPTLRANVVPGVAIEYNPTDSRIKVKEDGICQTLCARCGTGGNNVPLTMLPVTGDICPDQSGETLSGYTKVGFCEAETHHPPDGLPGPSRIKGGTVVLEEKPSYTMTCGSFLDYHEEVSPTLMARDYKDPPLVGEAPEAEYLVRRLTPDECCRLQGYPDGWCKNVEIPWPNEEDIVFWTEVFEEHRTATGSNAKPKTRRQIIQWLIRPGTDSAEYKAYGNSVAVPCVFFILAGIVWANEEHKLNGSEIT